MALYAVGDLQGCYEPLLRLLDQVNFDPAADTLWLTGDLVNRGPHSLACLRFVRSLGSRAVTVLGNHDLHLLAASQRTDRRHALSYILEAEDGPQLLSWLRQQPLMHYDKKRDIALVHAGILPAWSINKARKLAREVETELSGDGFGHLMQHLYGNKPTLWHSELDGVQRLRFIVNVFTRMRMLTRRGGLNLAVKGKPETAPAGSIPWFDTKHRRGKTRVVFGHWSALGFFQTPSVIGLDSGCVWGRQMTLIRISGKRIKPTSISCSGIVASSGNN
ncbi:MAG: symmetrical bis(5'-nucleosyl)-tetraphosphatase [Pseudomonadota bacterium]